MTDPLVIKCRIQGERHEPRKLYDAMTGDLIVIVNPEKKPRLFEFVRNMGEVYITLSEEEPR